MDDQIFDDRDALVEDHLKMLGFNDLNDVRIKLCDGEILTNKDILMATLRNCLLKKKPVQLT